MKRFGLLAIFALIAPASAWAQADRPLSLRSDPDAFLNQQRGIEEELRQEFDAEPAASAQRNVFDWGGWYTFNLFVFDDGVESSRTLRRHDLRLWGRATFDRGAHEFYARARLSFLDFNSGDSYDGNDDDTEGPNLERGFYRFDLARAVRASEGRSLDYNLVVTVGRDFAQFGEGLALSTTLDQVNVRTTAAGWELTTLAGKTVGSLDDFDLSRTAARLQRCFLGAQLKYVEWEKHEPFAYALWQHDNNHEERITPFQKFDYDSAYFGLGSTGELVHRLAYVTELVYESGESYGDGQWRRTNEIDAWAYRAKLEYLFPGDERARASAEYLFGSGDSGRLLSPTDTVGGNTGDYLDTSFVGLGYVDTGLALAPRYSNLHMWRVGGSMYPWPQHPRLKRLELGTDWYVFYKHHRDGAISDPTADRQSGYVGWEMDYFANWRMTADFAWTARFGTFFPGQAYSDTSPRPFLLVGMNWSF